MLNLSKPEPFEYTPDKYAEGDSIKTGIDNLAQRITDTINSFFAEGVYNVSDMPDMMAYSALSKTIANILYQREYFDTAKRRSAMIKLMVECTLDKLNGNF